MKSQKSKTNKLYFLEPGQSFTIPGLENQLRNLILLSTTDSSCRVRGEQFKNSRGGDHWEYFEDYISNGTEVVGGPQKLNKDKEGKWKKVVDDKEKIMDNKQTMSNEIESKKRGRKPKNVTVEFPEGDFTAHDLAVKNPNLSKSDVTNCVMKAAKNKKIVEVGKQKVNTRGRARKVYRLI